MVYATQVNAKLEAVSELREDVLQLMQATSSISHGLVDLQEVLLLCMHLRYFHNLMLSRIPLNAGDCQNDQLH